MSATGLPFDDVRALIAMMRGPDETAIAAVASRNAQLTKPVGSLGRLEDIASFIAGWQRKDMPAITRPLVAIFVANHGVARHNVSPFPTEVTRQMMENFTAGGGAINQICATFDIGLKVFDLALDFPTGDITEEAALDEKAAAATIAFGMEATAGGSDLLCLGDMGVGNTTVAAAIFHGLYGGTASEWVGRGSGIDDAGLARKIAAVEKAIDLHRPHLGDPLEVLRRLGGREVAAIVGAILAARLQNVPVILDGYVVTAAAAILYALDSTALDHCLAGHQAAEGAHAAVLERLGLRPILDLGMRLGEGSGAALAAAMVKASVACHTGMATYDQAKITPPGLG